MKKNVMMRVASVMMVLVLMTSSVISGTFAKYVTSGEAKDSARVAKWGVTVTADSNIFADQYDKDDSSFTLNTKTVITSGTYADINDLVAPGTKKDDVSTITLGGTPEVAARVEFIGTATLNDQWIDQNGNFYCPIVITIKDNTGAVKATIDGATYATAAEFETAIETYINNFSADYEPLTNLATQEKAKASISWAWPFSTNADNDIRDTYLGNSAAGLNDGKSAGTISIEVDCTVTQID